MILKETILSLFNERGTLLKWLKKVEKLITEKVLVKPVNNPQSTEIVAVDNTGAQVMLGVGAGLTVDNGVLKFADVYNGTVIIEKAESVLGLRRFKESVTPYTTLTSEEEGLSFYSTNYFDIPQIGDVSRVTPFINFGGEVFCIVGNGTEITNTLTMEQFSIYFSDGFEVISTANSTVDEWLLANTEGVSE